MELFPRKKKDRISFLLEVIFIAVVLLLCTLKMHWLLEIVLFIVVFAAYLIVYYSYMKKK